MQSKAYLGIDVSKGYSDFILLGANKEVLEATFQLDDNNPGREKLSQVIDEWFDRGLEELFCGVESTGGYENNWYNHLQKLSKSKNLMVARLNPKGVKSVSEAALKRTITDAVSAENIAVYLMSFPEKVVYSNNTNEFSSHFKEGRHCLSFKRMLVKQKVQLNNQLEKLLYQHFCETLTYCRHGIPNWLLKMLVKYPTANQVLKAGEKNLIKIKGISAEKARAILLKASLSNQVVSSRIEHAIKVTAKEIIHKQELIEEETKFLIEQYRDEKQVSLLNSIVGIGFSGAVNILLEIEDINRFSSAKKLCSFFGLHPTFKQSGDGTWSNKLSKKGRGEIRSILYMCCLSAIRADDNFKQLYARFRGKGMNHYQAICVVMHKMLRIIYGVLKSQKQYDPAVDRENVAKSAEKRKETADKLKEETKEKKRAIERYKDLEEDAPISRRAAQKRNKQETSQSPHLEELAGSIPAQG
jgi:transposase